MERWRLIDIAHKDPRMNLAIEEAIARAVGGRISPPTVRFWVNRNAVVIGRFQSADYEVDLQECRKYGVAVLRRFTGGGAVYQDDGNLNCAVALPCDHTLFRKSVPTLYSILGGALVEGLKSFGLEASMKSNSIYIDDKKISGMAGALDWGAAFHHCTLLVSANIGIMFKVLKPTTNFAQCKYVRSKVEGVTTLKSQLGRNIAMPEVKHTIARALEIVWGVELIEGPLSNEEKMLAQKLCEEKYSNSEHAILFEEVRD
jgi:lipoate-protein ligase A